MITMAEMGINKPLSYPFEYLRKMWADTEEETRKRVVYKEL